MVKPPTVESLAARLKLRHLQIALALRDAASAKEVAATANVSESAVSKTLAELESQLGFKLFERVGNARRLTEMGRQVLPMMELVLAQARGLAQSVMDVRDGRQGDLRIGVATDMGKLSLAPLIHAFNQARPGVALDVQAGGYRARPTCWRCRRCRAPPCRWAPTSSIPSTSMAARMTTSAPTGIRGPCCSI